jgi:predicted aminopeptidase
MNEYSVLYLNGINAYVTAGDFKDAILEARINASRKGFATNIKYIIDEDGVMIKNINSDDLSYNYCGSQALRVIASF